MTIQELNEKKSVYAAPNGIKGKFVRNHNKGGKWQHIDAILFGGYGNTYASYTDEEILASLC